MKSIFQLMAREKGLLWFKTDEIVIQLGMGNWNPSAQITIPQQGVSIECVHGPRDSSGAYQLKWSEAAKILKILDKREGIHVETKEDIDRLRVSAGDNWSYIQVASRFDDSGLPPLAAPPWGDTYPIPVPLADMSIMLPLASTDESRRNLCGIGLQIEQLRVFATNGHQMIWQSIDPEKIPEGLAGLKDYCIDSRIIQVAAAIGVDEIYMAPGGEWVRAVGRKGMQMVARNNAEECPGVSKVIEPYRKDMEDIGWFPGNLKAKDIKEVLEEAKAHSVEKPYIYYDPSERAWCTGDPPEGCKATERFSAPLFADALKAMQGAGDIRMQLSTSGSIAPKDYCRVLLMQNDARSALVMPVRWSV